jgi:pseudouridine-5'-phosphate glycosidase
MSVPIIGYKTREFPAFYSIESGLETTLSLDTPEQIVEFARAHWEAGLKSAILVANPIPASDAIGRNVMDPIIARASEEAQKAKIRGQALTPFLLQRIKELTEGKSVNANIALLLSNAQLAARIARTLSTRRRERHV